MSQSVFRVSLQLARAAVLRSVRQIAPVCGTIPPSVQLSSVTIISCIVDLCLALQLASTQNQVSSALLDFRTQNKNFMSTPVFSA